jgi:hypothetical protein
MCRILPVPFVFGSGGTTMRYALMIHVPEDRWDDASEAERERTLEAHRSLQADAKAKGEFVAAVRLMPTATATTVHQRGEACSIVDGPFQETKELLAGFYLVDCDGLDEALEYARGIPTFGGGSVEVRPVAWGELASSG